MTRITSRTVFGLALLLINSSIAYADVIDDNLAKAEKGVISAQKRLDTAKACIANRPICIADLTAKAVKSADRAAKKLADLKAASAE